MRLNPIFIIVMIILSHLVWFMITTTSWFCVTCLNYLHLSFPFSFEVFHVIFDSFVACIHVGVEGLSTCVWWLLLFNYSSVWFSICQQKHSMFFGVWFVLFLFHDLFRFLNVIVESSINFVCVVVQGFSWYVYDCFLFLKRHYLLLRLGFLSFFSIC